VVGWAVGQERVRSGTRSPPRQAGTRLAETRTETGRLPRSVKRVFNRCHEETGAGELGLLPSSRQCPRRWPSTPRSMDSGASTPKQFSGMPSGTGTCPAAARAVARIPHASLRLPSRSSSARAVPRCVAGRRHPVGDHAPLASGRAISSACYDVVAGLDSASSPFPEAAVPFQQAPVQRHLEPVRGPSEAAVPGHAGLRSEENGSARAAARRAAGRPPRLRLARLVERDVTMPLEGNGARRSRPSGRAATAPAFVPRSSGLPPGSPTFRSGSGAGSFQIARERRT